MIQKKNNKIAIVLIVIAAIETMMAAVFNIALLVSISYMYDEIEAIAAMLLVDIFLVLTYIKVIKALKTRSEIKYRQNIFYAIIFKALIPISFIVCYMIYARDIDTECMAIIIGELAWTIPLSVVNYNKLKEAVIADLKNKEYM